jgi:hypothetical protein
MPDAAWGRVSDVEFGRPAQRYGDDDSDAGQDAADLECNGI